MINYFQSKENSKSTLIILISIFLAIIGFYNHKIIIELYGLKGFELYSSILALTAIFSNFFLIGTRSTFLTLRDNKDLLKSYFIISSVIVLFFAFLSGILLNILLLNSHEKILNDYSFAINFFLIMQSMIFLFSFYLNALNKPVVSKLVSLFPAITLLIILLMKISKDIVTMMSYSFFITLIIFLPLFYLNLKKYKFLNNLDLNDLRKELYKGLNFAFSNVIDAFTNRLNILFCIFIISDLGEMAIYSIALSVSKISSLMINSISHVYSPKIADSVLIKKNKQSSYANNMKNISLLLTGMFFLTFLFLGEVFIEYFYPESYYESYFVALILLLGQICNSFFNSEIIRIKLSGNSFDIAKLKLILLPIFLIINYPLYHYLGLNGIAVWHVLFMNIFFNILITNVPKFSDNI
mgnify:CR=1 FL=1